jgi:crotonobetainyl-CoA:carnitine CoA-transferase CaiB-like acyl-CoA transferase
MKSPTEGPLNDVVVVDLTTMLAGPFATMVLADLGADVIKVEPPHGDFIRAQGPFAPDDELRAFGGYFQSVNRNKRGVVLDLTTEAGCSSLLELVAHADVVVENFRHGVMDRLGLSYERLREANPHLVYAAIRGFGDERTGSSPMRDWPAYDITVQALSGLMEITGEPGRPPIKTGPGLGDTVPALFAAIGVLSAVHRARRDGVGSFVDVSMYDAMLAMCERTVYQHSYTGDVPTRQGNSHPLLCPFDVVPAADGWVSIAAPGNNHWKQLCVVIGRPELATDSRTSDNVRRLANRDFTMSAITEWTTTRTKNQIIKALGGKVPVAPVNTVEDIYTDPHVHARNMLVEVEHPGVPRPLTIANTPIKFADAPPTRLRRAPLLGEHTDEVLGRPESTTAIYQLEETR